MTQWGRGRGGGRTVEAAGVSRPKGVGGVGWGGTIWKLPFPFGPDWKATRTAGGMSSSHPR